MALQAHAEQRQSNIEFREIENARNSEHLLIWQPDPEYGCAFREVHLSFLLLHKSVKLPLN